MPGRQKKANKRKLPVRRVLRRRKQKNRRGCDTAAVHLFLEGSSKNKTAALSDGRFLR
jgi:hypothetical protein